jgi:hypothetical protein
MPDEGINTLGSVDPAAVPVAVDMVGDLAYQRVKLDAGADGVSAPVVDADGSRLPVGGAQIGALTETAPASDTASSGLNGRLQRIAQRLSSILTQLTTAVTTISKVTSLPATVVGGASLSEAIDIRGYQVTGIVVPSTFDGTTINFQVSAVGVTYQALYDMTNTLVSMTVTASRSYSLWGELSGWSYVKIGTGTSQTGDTAFVLQLNSER